MNAGGEGSIWAKLYVESLPIGRTDFKLRCSPKGAKILDDPLCGRKRELGNLNKRGYTSKGMAPQ